MAHLRAFGSPHFLLTFTLNSEAPEFTDIIGTDDSWVNREDAVARLFINKEKELMDDIENRQILGPLAAQFGTVEHQKRFVLFSQFIVLSCFFINIFFLYSSGLPHKHIVIIRQTPHNNYFNKPDWVTEELCPETEIMEYIKAEIPALPEPSRRDLRVQKEHKLRETVLQFMIHSCSENCIVDGKCSKGFPKQFNQTNNVSDDAYPQYRRRPPALSSDDRIKMKANPEYFGEFVEIRRKNKSVAAFVDNRHVVPYNPWLLMKYGSQ